MLGGKCRTCKTPISAVYPLVELFTGAVFVWAWWQYGPGWLLVSHLLLRAARSSSCSSSTSNTRSCPTSSRCGGIVIGFLFSLINPPGWRSSLLGIVLGGLIP